MKKVFKKALFIFRRDLRLDDNTGLIQSLQLSQHVIPCFIFDPSQVEEQNKFRSLNCMQFMIESLIDLDQQLQKRKAKLYLFYGEPREIVQNLIKEESVNAVFCNMDYTPFSLKRDEILKQICIKNNITFITSNDLLLINPELIKTSNGTPYSIFTAFYKHCRRYFEVQIPVKNKYLNFYSKTITNAHSKTIYKKIAAQYNKKIYENGGRQEGLKILKNLKKFNLYSKDHDMLAKNTTGLSPHHKFGTISIRESYQAISKKLGNNHPLIRQLYWRDFFTYVAYHSPFVFGSAYKEKYNKLWWENDPKKFAAWCQGKTGFPIIDAGMRQLNETGFMHNRARLIVGSFLVKDLHIDWQWGEKYFAQKLIDYDPAVNNGNWQWVASTGCDAQPYFRIFNPWLQQKKFDKDCTYIKRWVPELKNIDPKIIHNWYKSTQIIKNYPKPIVDHEKESKKAKILYRNL